MKLSGASGPVQDDPYDEEGAGQVSEAGMLRYLLVKAC